MARWRKGQSGNLRGRPKGIVDRRALTIAERARELLEDPAYQTHVRQRLLQGLCPQLEITLYHYAYGKPPDKVDISLFIRQQAEALAAKYDLEVEALIAQAEAMREGLA